MPDLVLRKSGQQIRQQFNHLDSLDALARLLEVKRSALAYYAYGPGHVYRRFTVRKRRGGNRQLSEPLKGLKAIQQKLNYVFSLVYEPRDCVHGFIPGRSIGTNAACHADRRWVLNVDLTDFFPAIHFGRIRGRLIARPYCLRPQVATVIAQLCSDNGLLPQGAPSSPVISNMVASKLDADLDRLARRYGCTYTRYADDLTFSCDAAVFPGALGFTDTTASPPVSHAGDILEAAIADNWFQINPAKTRLRRSNERQEVTGLAVNVFPNVQKSYVRRIRAMIHSWRILGPERALEKHLERATKDRGPHSSTTSFAAIVKGHIDFLGMVRGQDHPWYRGLISEFADLHPTFRRRPVELLGPNHVTTRRDGVWVLWADTDTGPLQGTAFEFTGYGLITAAHNLFYRSARQQLIPFENWRVFHPQRSDVEYRLTVDRVDWHLDLAVYQFQGSRGFEFEAQSRRMPEVGDAVTVLGYPRHVAAMGLAVERGEVVATERATTPPHVSAKSAHRGGSQRWAGPGPSWAHSGRGCLRRPRFLPRGRQSGATRCGLDSPP